MMAEIDRPPTPTSSDTDEGFDRSFTPTTCPMRTKIFHDTIHSHMELPYLCYEIINTPQFQRLRNLKQLGLCSFVYPAASHNRFEHCIGTCYLAGRYCRALQKHQPELQIDATDILCVQIAGLCHDLGHGPFSHLWEHFLKRFQTLGDKKYCHEEMSIKMFDFLLEDNKLRSSFRNAGLCDHDLVFIKEAIYGKPLNGNAEFTGRNAHKYFLYQIISNDETKVDVDKFDYLLRDSKQLNIPIAFDYERVMDNSRVISVDIGNGEFRSKIAYRVKVAENLNDLFRGRFRLHQNAYQHKVILIAEEMLLDGLTAADPHLRVYGQDGTIYKLSTAHKDPSAFMTLTDSVFELITNRKEGGDEAAEIFNRILRRDLYIYFGFFMEPPKGDDWNKLVQNNPKLAIIRANFNYGKVDQHPLAAALFYEKHKPDSAFLCYYPLPPSKSKFHVVHKGDGETALELEALHSALREWGHQHDCHLHYE